MFQKDAAKCIRVMGAIFCTHNRPATEQLGLLAKLASIISSKAVILLFFLRPPFPFYAFFFTDKGSSHLRELTSHGTTAILFLTNSFLQGIMLSDVGSKTASLHLSRSCNFVVPCHNLDSSEWSLNFLLIQEQSWCLYGCVHCVLNSQHLKSCLAAKPIKASYTPPS